MSIKSNKMNNSDINANIGSNIRNDKDTRVTIIPNTTIYKVLRAFICFTLFSLSILYLIFSCLYAVEYRPLIFDNILTETIKGTIKGTNGEYIQWIATIPTGLVSRTVSIICVVMFLIFGVYTFIFSFYTICKKYRFIQPWYFILLSTISSVGGLISIFLSNKFDVVRELTGLEDCPIQSVVSNDCSMALASDEIYAYDLCKAVESFCSNEHSSISGYYTKSIIVAVFSFFVTFVGFAYGIILLRLKIRYSKKLALSEKNGVFDPAKTQIELSNQKQICQHENKGFASEDLKSGSSANSSTRPHTLYCQNSVGSSKMIGNFKHDLKPLPMGIMVTTTTKQCHVSHPHAIEIPQFSKHQDNSSIGCINSIRGNSTNCLNGLHNGGNLNVHNHHHHHGHHHHHHHHAHHNPNHVYKNSHC
ncbi:hypothetical protein FG379_001137 [Cryptosporidium bovis]|uniref:uncharacterized protein n=1 Tax=Cryptosporidium bovis TaxID=310047 RepID=UPI00351A8A13|nr:hypothetical protein FG379_001137 [Cryptosporidium bovis]